MRNLLGIITATLCLAMIPPLAYAAKAPKASKASKPSKEKLVLMPMRVPEEDKNLQGAMQTALVQGLQQKYEVLSGEQVSQKAREIFMKESRNTAKKDCDETRCMQDIAMAFQAELIATAYVTKREDGYFLALSIKNIFDNLEVYSNATPCKHCDAYQVVDKLKELSGAPEPAAPLVADKIEPAPGNKAFDPESTLWEEVKNTNTLDDYGVYLAQYPKGKYVALAKSRIKKMQEAAAAEATRKEQDAWEVANKLGSVDGYQTYLKDWPAGQYAGLAQVRLKKLDADLAARQEQELWQQAQAGENAQDVQAYLDRYPSGSHVAAAWEKLAAIRKNENERNEMSIRPQAMLSSTYAQTRAGEMPDLAKRNNCIACHAIGKKVVGPAWNDVARKYKGDAGAKAKLVTKIMKGGGGVWGSMPMPASPKLSEADAGALADFVLGLAK